MTINDHSNKPSGDSHRARKRFGQNFLVDSYVIQSIINAVNPQPDDLLVEIGPGQGALTKSLYAALNHLHVVEIDRDLAENLERRLGIDEGIQNDSSISVHLADALKFSFEELIPTPAQQLRVVGNLPYNISSPLLFRLLPMGNAIADMHFMLQREVVERMAAPPGSKTYGRLSVMVQSWCEVKFLIDVPPSAFRPAPKVDSGVVRLVPKQLTLQQQQAITAMEPIVRAAFSQRRKTLRNSLREYITAESLEELGINPTARAETLSQPDYLNIAKKVISSNE